MLNALLANAGWDIYMYKLKLIKNNINRMNEKQPQHTDQ